MATIYKVRTLPACADGGSSTETVVHVRWASSEGAARKAKKELADELGLRPLKDVEYVQVEVPTSKAGLIEWLNANHAKEPVGGSARPVEKKEAAKSAAKAPAEAKAKPKTRRK